MASTSEELQNNGKSVKINKRITKCHPCNKVFNTIEAKKLHLKEKHVLPECICGETFTFLAGLCRHRNLCEKWLGKFQKKFLYKQLINFNNFTEKLTWNTNKK